MTVRVNKQPFNIREKLSELERPIGVKGNELMRAETAQDARDFVSAGRKNMIINGDMRIDQRYNGSPRDIADSTDEYVVDRFIFREQTSTSVRIQRNSGTASTDPPGFKYAVKWSCLGNDTSIATTEYARIQHYIETNNLKCDWGVKNTDYLTLSFWVKSDVPGKYYVNLEDGDASPIYLKPYYINQADTWQKVELTYPPPPSGGWTASTDNGIGMRITWALTIGSTYVDSNLEEGWTTSYKMAGPGQVNLVGGTGNAFWMTGVQLEVGKNATEFEHRSYGEELALCQRYYQVIQSGWWATRSATGTVYSNAGLDGSTITLPVAMRAIPTARGYGTSNTTITSSGYNSSYATVSSNYELYVQRQYSTVSGIVICNLGYNQANNGNSNLPTSIVMLNTAEATEFDAEL